MCFSARKPDPVAEVFYGPGAQGEGVLEDDVLENEHRHELAGLGGEGQFQVNGDYDGANRHGGDVRLDDDVEMPILEAEAPIAEEGQHVRPENTDRILELRLLVAIEDISKENERLSAIVRELQEAVEQQTAILNRLYQDRLDIDLNNNEGADELDVDDHPDDDDTNSVVTADESSGQSVDLSISE